MTEEKIIQKVRKGDRAAQGQLYAHYQTLWYSICLRYQSDRADAADALQNGLINIFGKINQYDSSKGSFKSWSCQVVVNENLMLLRKQSLNFSIDNLDDAVGISYQGESALDILSAEELTKLIQNLPSGYRTIFNLYVLEGMTHREIATQLNITEGTSKSQLFKAKKMLQEQLEVLI